MYPSELIPLELWSLVYAFVARIHWAYPVSLPDGMWPPGAWTAGRAFANSCTAFRHQGWYHRTMSVRLSCRSFRTWTHEYSHGLVWARIALTDSPNGCYDNDTDFTVALWYLQQRAPMLLRLQLIIEPDGGMGPDNFRLLGGLNFSSSLQHLHFTAECCDIDTDSALHLGLLGRTRNIFTLHLGLNRSSLGPGAAQRLAQVTESSPLVGLSVSLDGCSLGDDGAVAIADLSRNWYLAHLRLSLRCNFFYDAGGAALAEIPKRHGLQSLTMVLSDNYISDSSAWAFADLGPRGTLASLDLVFNGNRLGDSMAQSLAAAIHGAPTVRKVRLSLEVGSIGDVGAHALSSIMYLPRVVTLDLSLRFNQVGPMGQHMLLGDQHMKVASQNRFVLC
jgi:hypothetical protein